MADWQIELVKALGLALIGFISGYGVNWLKNRDRHAKLSANLDELKAKRRLEGSSEAERLERAAKVTDMLITHKLHEITPEQFRQFHDEILQGKRKQRTTPQVALLPSSAEKGPNGGRVEILPNGDKVEWIADDEEGDEFPMILRRGDTQIQEAEGEFFDKVWWNRHQIWKEKIEAGEEPPPDPGIWKAATAAAQRIEAQYGVDSLGWDDFEWGMVNGKLSALRWVLGGDWDFLDT